MVDSLKVLDPERPIREGGHMDASDLIKALQNHLARRGTVHIS